MIKLLLLILIIEAYHCYITSFNIVIRKNMIGSVSNFLNLNEILNNNDSINYMKITKFNNSSICFNYKTYSNFEDYEYNNIYLIKNKNTYLTTYNFINFNEEYKYLFYIKAFYKSQNRTIWNIIIKYNNLIVINKEANDKIIYDYLYRCLNKKTNEIYHPILLNLFK
jgi:hypothetical protein